ncbi:MAG: hypothetical protein Q8N51_18635 [Gammaproteobacteria bacterium]|nr:hypothetical protein [Gammaproteobacteria bacterium]
MSSHIIEHRRTERRHMIAVKDALAAGLGSSPANPEFVLACVDYLGYIVGRFNAQGNANLKCLLPRVVAKHNDDDRRIVADIAATIHATEAELGLLLAAATKFRQDRESSVSDLLQAGHGFVSFYNSILASRKNPAQDIISRYFDDAEYWALTNDVTPASIEAESSLFLRVTGLAPPGVEFLPWGAE